MQGTFDTDLRGRIKAVLHTITCDRQLEAAWLNTLSRLEHIGARKISRTVAASHPTGAILEHLSDEARHACVFKQLSDHLSPGAPYMHEAAAVHYFQSLDAHVSTWITQRCGTTDTHANYAVVTTLIERRAMMIYPLYLSLTQDPRVQSELQKVIREEADHRGSIEEVAYRLLAHHGITEITELEHTEALLFEQFLGALETPQHDFYPQPNLSQHTRASIR